MGMVVDVGVVKNHIKPKADSTLYNMQKVDLIEYIRTLEHNYNVAVSFNENQAKYIESLDITEVVRCKDCKKWFRHTAVDRERGECRRYQTTKHETGYCDRGERKDND